MPVRHLSAAFFRFMPPVLANKWRTELSTNGHQMSQITVTTKVSRKGDKTWYYLEWGKEADQRRAAGIFSYLTPKSQTQKNHNKEALALLEVKKSQLTIEFQFIGTAYIPGHKFKYNFLDYYQEFVNTNKRKGNRHLEGSLSKFRAFLPNRVISPLDVTENLCKRFKAHLNDTLTGKTPLDYFNAFKRVLRSAAKEGYFRINPSDGVRGKTNASKRLKDFLEPDELISIIDTPIFNPEIREAFVVCCYTGLRWCDIKTLSWSQIKLTKKGSVLVTKIIQAKTGKPVELTLHPLALAILEEKREKYLGHQKPKAPVLTITGQKIGEPAPTDHIFDLPTQDGANKSLGKWAEDCAKKHGLEDLAEKHLTWHSARLTFSILLQDAGVDPATVALLLGHTTTKYVLEVYKRHRPKDQLMHIAKLPSAQWRVA
jgi:integrase